MKPLHTGIALALTLVMFYSLCALMAVIWPDQFVGFMNSFFHGLDFRKVLASEPYTWTSFFVALAVFAAWGFLIGAFFAWLYNVVSGVSAGKVNS